ncbi:hypothetical protein BAE44_0022648 [Dichanthelium oligosanthes]|uniref:Uncharacterized protein n=1 Tax=Dichanthelium oligosanthes TaxID=888268 RepID=A0A1E5UU34_9POAL|nr:hypothetical protein BAE44_0022648 [Dichanthelium oligosanthes]
MHVERISLMKEADNEVAAEIRNLVAVEREKIGIEKLKLDSKRIKDDERIMTIDLSSCNPAQRAMYESLQNEILAHYVSRAKNSSMSQ